MTTRGIFDTERFVTGEAVEIELPAASLPLRMAGGLIDLALIVVGVLLAAWLVPWDAFVTDVALGQALVIVLMVLVMAGVPIALETLTHGRTVGKLALGMRTVRDDTGPIGLRHAVIRALAGTVELWLTLGSVALVTAATNERAKRLGDLLAGTYVVRDRVRLEPAAPPQMSPRLQEWARGADIGALPGGLVVAVRQLLARSASLTPESRLRATSELLPAVTAHVSPPPPAWAAPEEVLASVLAERRRRDEQRLARADALRERLLPAERQAPGAQEP